MKYLPTEPNVNFFTDIAIQQDRNNPRRYDPVRFQPIKLIPPPLLNNDDDQVIDDLLEYLVEDAEYHDAFTKHERVLLKIQDGTINSEKEVITALGENVIVSSEIKQLVKEHSQMLTKGLSEINVKNLIASGGQEETNKLLGKIYKSLNPPTPVYKKMLYTTAVMVSLYGSYSVHSTYKNLLGFRSDIIDRMIHLEMKAEAFQDTLQQIPAEVAKEMQKLAVAHGKAKATEWAINKMGDFATNWVINKHFGPENNPFPTPDVPERGQDLINFVAGHAGAAPAFTAMVATQAGGHIWNMVKGDELAQLTWEQTKEIMEGAQEIARSTSVTSIWDNFRTFLQETKEDWRNPPKSLLTQNMEEHNARNARNAAMDAARAEADAEATAGTSEEVPTNPETYGIYPK